ncbi:hypothetical protein TR75_09390 [Hydrogenibacillus schlegelii]|uniref:Uncharacterized protein n=1 Tax=Hydrogenibacillus schlegelii TaxID=1484 RepID=A0A132MIN0_HYDSH|nr:hypothetical protein TR75_09390 [Hydrogenibacillus schlegelii]OAR05575.1 hypothetical protein SA87_11935 [Hydrogenibacillus schlegelii]PTQ53674.1 MAG: hypothetical protein HSCHL_1603 [Hydrogenibacillus schlegelii]
MIFLLPAPFDQKSRGSGLSEAIVGAATGWASGVGRKTGRAARSIGPPTVVCPVLAYTTAEGET